MLTFSLQILTMQFIILQIGFSFPTSHPVNDEQKLPGREMSKLLIILLDGFRWDYYQRQKPQLPGLSHFISDGVHAEWVEPIFPSLSFPSWQTIATGLYPESHNILGNYMLQMRNQNQSEMTFQLKDNSTKLEKWWKYAEPIWITATKHGRKSFLANWARCDVPFEGVSPTECSGYVYNDVNSGFRSDLQAAVKRLKNDYSLAMVYDDFIDHVGHKYGPDSQELRIAMIQRDSQLHELLVNIQFSGLANKINIAVISDHGMASLKKTQFVHLSEYLDEADVYKIVDYGAVVSIAANQNRSEALQESLKRIPGIDAYHKSEIPEEFHYKGSPLVLDFLLVGKPGFAMVGLTGDKQIPNDKKSSAEHPYAGSHGYHKMEEMRTIFYAKGPAFKQGWRNSPIRLEDEYQIFMEVLDLPALPNNGSWSRVQGMFA